jgi:hypothetical protein
VNPRWDLRDMMNTFLHHPGQTNKETACQSTAVNIMAYWAFIHFGFMGRPVNSGNHLMNASIDRM